MILNWVKLRYFIVSLDLQLTETYTVKLFFANG